MNDHKPFKFWCQHVLPLVYDDSLSYYELLCKVVNYINQLLGDVSTLSRAFTQLKSYVDNYFSTVDFQTMVDEKLDEMAENGELQNIIGKFLPVLYVDSVGDISTLETVDFLANNTNVKIIKTKGYYSINDGGASTFYIGETADNDVPLSIEISTNVYANIMKKSRYYAAELGFKNDRGETNNTLVFNALHPCKCEILFDSGYYAFDELLITKNNHYLSFIGMSDKSPAISEKYGNVSDMYRGVQTFFIPYRSQQKHIMKIGGDNNYTDMTTAGTLNNIYFTGFKISGITFTDDNIEMMGDFKFDTNSNKYIRGHLLFIEYCAMISGDLQFRNSTSLPFGLRNTWEHYYKYIIMRSIFLIERYGETAACIEMFSKTSPTGNITAFNVDLIDVEGFQTPVLSVESAANFGASTIGNIQVEGSINNNNGGSNSKRPYANIRSALFIPTSNYTETDINNGYEKFLGATMIPLIHANGANGVIINNVQMQNVGLQYFTINGIIDAPTWYVHGLISGYNGIKIINVVQDTTFHYFNVFKNGGLPEINAAARHCTIVNYMCDKSQLIPALNSSYDWHYRAICESGCEIIHSSIPLYSGDMCYSNNTDIDYLCGSIGRNCYINDYLLSGHSRRMLFISSQIPVIIQPRILGVCNGIVLSARRANCTIKVNRYINGTLVDSTPLSTADGAFMQTTYTLPTKANYNEYEIVYEPDTSAAGDKWVRIAELNVIKNEGIRFITKSITTNANGTTFISNFTKEYVIYANSINNTDNIALTPYVGDGNNRLLCISVDTTAPYANKTFDVMLGVIPKSSL